MKKVKKVGAKCHYNNRILNKCLVLLLSLLFFGCGTSNDDTSSQTDLQELTKIEVTEYEGKDLSSLTDFRENSIKGPQYINTDVYTLTIDGLVEQPNSLTYDEVLDRKLGVMDLTAICLCRDHNMPLRVFNMNKPGALLNIVLGGAEGTLIEENKQ